MTGSVYDTRDRLLELADTWPRLEQALGGLKGVVYDDMPKPASKERHLPINAAVSDLMAEIRAGAAFLARTLREQGTRLPATHTPTLLRELANHADILTAHPEMERLGPVLAEWVAKARGAIGHRKARMPGCRQPGCNGTYTANNGRLECSTGNPLHTVNITRPPTINEAALTRLRQAATQG